MSASPNPPNPIAKPKYERRFAGDLSESEVWWREHQAWLSAGAGLHAPSALQARLGPVVARDGGRPLHVRGREEHHPRSCPGRHQDRGRRRRHAQARAAAPLPARDRHRDIPLLRATRQRWKESLRARARRVGRARGREAAAGGDAAAPGVRRSALPECGGSAGVLSAAHRGLGVHPCAARRASVSTRPPARRDFRPLSDHILCRDCGRQNIMMDPRGLLPDLFHFAAPWRSRDMSRYVRHSTRTRRPVKYYFIDFGLARRYDPAAGPPRAWPIFGGDKTVPEFAKSLEPCDPIPTDVYYLGNAMHTAFLRDFVGAEVLQPLVADMVQDDPSRRPAMSEVAARFDVLMGTLGSWTLRARLVPRGEHWVVRCFRASAHAVRTLWYILTLRSALPRP